MTAERYVSFWRGRYAKPKRNIDRWYRCRCGRWWGVNKRFLCTCGKAPPSMPRHRARESERLFRKVEMDLLREANRR